MKKLFIGGTAAALIAAAGISTPYYLGNQAKQSLETQHRILADTFFFDIVSRQYQSGWLESTETTHIAGGTARAGERIPAHVDNAAFFGVEEEFLGDGDFAKFFGRFLGAIDIRMVFTSQPTVRLFNIIVGCVWG